jgi:AmmeMemoRadiSam system protein B
MCAMCFGRSSCAGRLAPFERHARCSAALTMQPMEFVRPPAAAGTFYPDDASLLASEVDAMLDQAEQRLTRRALDRGELREHERPKALVVPHAGYEYSGATAAAAYAELAPFVRDIARVVLLGPAHRMPVAGLASPGASGMRTPLGVVPIDEDSIARVASILAEPLAHSREHSLEVQLPFLQRLFARAGARVAPVVPLLTSRARPERVGAVLEALWGGSETVVIVSTDLSHYLPYEAGRSLDRLTVDRILALDSHVTTGEACGAACLDGLLWVAHKKGLHPKLLELTSSGDAGSGHVEVVGYAALSFTEAPDGVPTRRKP